MSDYILKKQLEEEQEDIEHLKELLKMEKSEIVVKRLKQSIKLKEKSVESIKRRLNLCQHGQF